MNDPCKGQDPQKEHTDSYGRMEMAKLGGLSKMFQQG